MLALLCFTSLTLEKLNRRWPMKWHKNTHTGCDIQTMIDWFSWVQSVQSITRPPPVWTVNKAGWVRSCWMVRSEVGANSCQQQDPEFANFWGYAFLVFLIFCPLPSFSWQKWKLEWFSVVWAQPCQCLMLSEMLYCLPHLYRVLYWITLSLNQSSNSLLMSLIKKMISTTEWLQDSFFLYYTVLSNYRDFSVCENSRYYAVIEILKPNYLALTSMQLFKLLRSHFPLVLLADVSIIWNCWPASFSALYWCHPNGSWDNCMNY